MLVAPTGLADFSFCRRHRFHRFFILVENKAVGAIANGVRFNLNPLPQRLLEHWLQVFFLHAQESGAVG